MTAADALMHNWLNDESPAPTPIDQMPRFQSQNEARAVNASK
jgi:hypothetical protein